MTTAQVGSLSDRPSTAYLEQLRARLYGWINSVEAELQKAHEREAKEVPDDDDDEEDDSPTVH